MVEAMIESLQELFRRRQRELGVQGNPLTTREVWLRADGRVSYETFRRIEKGTHTKIGDEVADALAIALDVPVSTVLAAAGQRPRLGKFELPRRADRLNEDERRVVVSVVDAILTAGQRDQDQPGAEPSGTNVTEMRVAGRADERPRVKRAARKRPDYTGGDES